MRRFLLPEPLLRNRHLPLMITDRETGRRLTELAKELEAEAEQREWDAEKPAKLE